MKNIKSYTYVFLIIIFGCMVYLFLQRNINEIEITIIGIGERKGKYIEIYTAQGAFLIGDREFLELKDYDNRLKSGEFYYKAKVIANKRTVKKVVEKKENKKSE